MTPLAMFLAACTLSAAMGTGVAEMALRQNQLKLALTSAVASLVSILAGLACLLPIW